MSHKILENEGIFRLHERIPRALGENVSDERGILFVCFSPSYRGLVVCVGDERVDDVCGIPAGGTLEREMVMVWAGGLKADGRGARKIVFRFDVGQESAHTRRSIVEFLRFFMFIEAGVKIVFGHVYADKALDSHMYWAILG